MESERTEVVSVGLDVSLIGAAVRELAGAYRNVSSYPKGHPVVVQACERAAGILARVFSDREAITMGVVRETLMVGGDSLGALAPAARNYVRTLAHHGVALITFRKGVAADEIEWFSQILTEKRAEISANGGIEKVVHGAGIRHLEVCSIQYDSFQAAENVPLEERRKQSPGRRSLWETFIERLMQGAEGSFLTGLGLNGEVSPSDMIGLVNSRSQGSMPRIADVLEELIREIGGLGQLNFEEKLALANIGEFIGGLKPELRRLFFDRVLQYCQQEDFSVLEIMPFLPTSAVLELFTCSLESDVVLPSYIMNSMEHMADAFSKESALVPPVSQINPTERKEGYEIFFREDIVDTFVPADYLDTLKTLVTSQSIPEPAREDFQEQLGTLTDDRVESAISRIILESLSFAGSEQLGALKRNLQELCRYFLEVGDFQSLENMYARLCGIPFEKEELVAMKEEVLENFHAAEFVAEVLNGAENWGKDKFEEIGEIIQCIGKPFIEPLLDRLAEEERRTIRRYYLDQLIKMSGQAKEAACTRLGDSRWYFIRNLVDILEHSGDPEVLVHLRKVAGFPHPKVRQRVIEALLSFGDLEGDKLLLHDLMSRDAEARQSAIQQAGKSRDPDVVGALMLILGKKGMSPTDAMEKKTAIQALAEIGDSRVFPLFDRMLAARHFLRLSMWNMLKKEILNSLLKYRDPSALELVRKVAGSGKGELANLAARLTRWPREKA
ncbi:MAG: hypothetical protein PHD01_02080 [Geobacteraceae bacterium]|nr:hypothetical protein [Geobacteraceae bacterium]